MESITVPQRFFQSKAWKNQQIIRSFLEDPKTFPEICEILKSKQIIKNPKSSVQYALTDLIRRGEVIGEINAESLKIKKIKGRLIPVYRRTGKIAIFHGEAPKPGQKIITKSGSREYRNDDYDVMRVYIDPETGGPFGKQFFKKIKAKHGKGHGYRRVTPIIFEPGYKFVSKNEVNAYLHEGWKQLTTELDGGKILIRRPLVFEKTR